MTIVDVPARRRLRLVRSLGYCAALLPVGLAALVMPGRDSAARWLRLRAFRDGGSEPEPVVSRAAVAGHAGLSLLLGVVALIPFGLLLAFVARGMFYGLVDPGPYDHSWGGPTRAGAWIVHFLVSLPAAAAAVLLLDGLAAVHSRSSAGLAGRRPAGWVLVVAVLAPVPAVVFFVAWLRQI